MRNGLIDGWRHGAAVLALGVALASSGCNRANEATVEQQQASTASLPDLPATLPLGTGDATQPSYAPPADQLPDVAPVRAVRVADSAQSYAYADTAYDFTDALGDAPPDYAFDYDGADPWAWQGYDDSTVFAEPVDGGYRSYFYRPGADAPYLIRDPDYAYGFDGGNLAVVYGNDGGIVPWADYGPRIVYASRYLARGRDMWRASRMRRVPVVAANWSARRPVILQTRRAWGTARVQQPGWAAYRQQYNRDARTYWRAEARRREADARRFAGWQNANFRTPPPPRAIPANWQRASWARDERRFAPVREERRALFETRRAEAARDARFDAQRRQAIAAREQAQAQRQIRIDQRQQAGFQRAAWQQDRARQIADRNREQADRRRDRRQDLRLAQDNQRERAERQRRGVNQARALQQAQRAQADQARQAHRAERQQRDQARAAQQAQRAQADQARQAQRADRQQRDQARAAQQAQRAQADQARQAQRAERQQRDQARQAQQAQRAQADQARQAQRAQAEQARAARQQEQAARQQQRAERMANRPDRGGGGRER